MINDKRCGNCIYNPEINGVRVNFCQLFGNDILPAYCCVYFETEKDKESEEAIPQDGFVKLTDVFQILSDNTFKLTHKVKKVLKSFQRENVVEVIRCKDCARWMDRSGRTGYCEEQDLYSDEDFYCAYGTTTCPHFYKGYCGKFEDGCFHQCKENKQK